MLPLWSFTQDSGQFHTRKGAKTTRFGVLEFRAAYDCVSLGFLVGPTVAKFQRFNPIDYF